MQIENGLHIEPQTKENLLSFGFELNDFFVRNYKEKVYCKMLDGLIYLISVYDLNYVVIHSWGYNTKKLVKLIANVDWTKNKTVWLFYSIKDFTFEPFAVPDKKFQKEQLKLYKSMDYEKYKSIHKEPVDKQTVDYILDTLKNLKYL